MKKLFAIALLGVVFTSCKKTKGLSSGTIQTNIDGKNYNFNLGPYGYIYPTSGETYLFAQDSVGLQANSFSIDLYLNDGSGNPLQLTNGSTYQNNDSTELDIRFLPKQNWDSSYRNNSMKPFSITFTNTTLPNLEGRFSGMLYLNGDTTLASKNVTGSFNISSVESNEY